MYAPLAPHSSEDQTKTAFGVFGVIGTLLAGWFGLRKQSSATEQARIEAEAKQKQFKDDEEKRKADLEAKQIEAEARKAEALEREHQAQIRRTGDLEEMVDTLQRRVLRQGDECLNLRRELSRAVDRLAKSIQCSCPCPNCDKCTEKLRQDRAMIEAETFLNRDDHDASAKNEGDRTDG